MSVSSPNSTATSSLPFSVIDFTIQYGSQGIFCWDTATPNRIWISENLRKTLGLDAQEGGHSFFAFDAIFCSSSIALLQALVNGKQQLDINTDVELQLVLNDSFGVPQTLRLVCFYTDSVRSTCHYFAVDTFLGTKFSNTPLKERIKEAEDLADIGYWEHRLSDDRLFWSEAVYRIFGVQKNTIIYLQDFFDLVHPDDRDLVKESFSKAQSSDGNYHVIHRINRPDGEVCFVEERANLCNSDGTLSTTISGTVQDITASQTEKAKLLASEVFFRKTLESSPIPHGINTNDGHVVYLNQEFTKCFGYDVSDIPNMESWWEKAFPNPKVRRLVQLEWKAKIAYAKAHNEKKMTVFAEITCKDNTIKHVIIRSSALDVASGTKTYLITLQDLTTLKEAELRLQDSERRFSKIFGESPIPYVLVNGANLRVEQVNAAWLQLFQTKKRKVEGASFMDLSIWTDRRQLAFRDTFEKLEPLKAIEFALQGMNGSDLFCSISAIPFTSIHDDFFIFLFEDITERKRKELQLKVSEARFRDIAAVNQTVIWEMDLTGLFTYVSPVAEQVWGYRPDELVGRVRFFDLHPKEGRNEFRDTMLLLGEGRSTFKDYVNAMERPDGSIVYLSTNGGPVLDETGKVIAYRGSDSDITDRVIAEKAAFEVQQRLEKLTREVPGAVCQMSLSSEGILLFPFLTPSFFDLFELPNVEEKELTGLFLRQICFDDLQRWEAALFESAKNQSILKLDFRVNLPKRGVVWISINARPERQFAGATLWNGIFIDVTQRVQDELNLKKLSEAVRQSSAAVIITDAKGIIEFVNPKFEELSGYQANEVLGKHPKMLSAGSASTRFFEIMWNTILEGITWSGEFENRRKDGTVYWEFATISPVKNADNAVTHFIAIKEDITFKKAAEQQLMISEERYRSIIDVSNVGAWEYDLSTQHLWCSANYFQMLNRKKEDFLWAEQPNLETVWLDLIHPDDRLHAKETFFSFLENPVGTYENTFRLLKKDGTVAWIWSRGKLLVSADNKSSILGAHIEITEQILSKQKAEEHADYLNSIFRTLPDMLFVMTIDGVYIDFKAQEDNLFVSPDFFIGKNMVDVMPAFLVKQHSIAVLKAVEKNMVVQYEYELVIKEQSQSFRARVVPFSDDKIIVLISDITTEKTHINKIENLLQTEAQQNKRLRNFTHIVSHNLRSHSANIKAIFDILNRSEPHFFQNEFFKMLQESTQNLHETIDYLNEVLVINSTNNKLQYKKMNVSKVVDAAHANVNLLAREAGLQVFNAV
ncbi:MAG: PAS domain S-box protein, partial [Schleiferiaceae bacterium]|nr:PAS domain S-box protein [Schleiferiaceae bacterium]